MLTHDEVIWGYRYLLGREPEGARVVVSHAMENANWQAFRVRLLASPEFRRSSAVSSPTSRWVATEIQGGKRLIWLDLADDYVSRGCLLDAYEPLESEFVRTHLRPGDVFVDVGANIGWFTLLASTIVGATGHVHAFEPRRPTVEYLRRSVAMSGLDAFVTVHDVGLSNTPGECRLGWDRGSRNPGHSYLVETETSDLIEAQPIRLDTLDRIAIGRVDMIKIDVEGAEMLALSGAEETIAVNRPFVLSELYPAQLKSVSKATPADFIAWFKLRGYRAKIVDPRRTGEEIDDFPADWHKELVNVAFIPQDRVAGPRK